MCVQYLQGAQYCGRHHDACGTGDRGTGDRGTGDRGPARHVGVARCGLLGADCSHVARAITPGPPPQPHSLVSLGLEVLRCPHFWGGGSGQCPGSLGRGVSGLFSSIFSPHP